MKYNNINRRIFYISFFLTTIATSLHHSILTVLLLSRGLNISDIVLVQLFFNVAIVLFEFPSGVLADLYSRKFLYMFSNLFLIIFFVIVYFSSNIFMLATAWFVYGLSNALSSGTIDAQLVNDIKRENDNLLHIFIRNVQQLNMIGLILGSSIGSFLYFTIGANIYVLGIIMTVIAILVVLPFKNNQTVITNENNKLKAHLSQVFNDIKESKIIQLLTISTMISQIFMQTHFQLWQNYLLDISINKKILFIFYILFQAIGFFIIYVPLFMVDRIIKKRYIFIIVIIPMILLIGMKAKYSIVIYCVITAIFTLINFYINTNFSKFVSEKNISSITSFRGTITRITSIIILALSGLMLKFMTTTLVIIVNFLIATIIIVYLLNKITQLKNKTN